MNEKKFSLYNEQGQVQDPEIARKMASAEEPYRKKAKKRFLGIGSEEIIRNGEGEADYIGRGSNAEKINEELIKEIEKFQIQFTSLKTNLIKNLEVPNSDSKVQGYILEKIVKNLFWQLPSDDNLKSNLDLTSVKGAERWINLETGFQPQEEANLREYNNILEGYKDKIKKLDETNIIEEFNRFVTVLNSLDLSWLTPEQEIMAIKTFDSKCKNEFYNKIDFDKIIMELSEQLYAFKQLRK